MMKDNVKHNPGERTRNNAKAAESWLIYLSRNLGKISRRGKNEIDLLVDSVGSAYRTTKNTTKRMAKYSKRKQNPSSSDELLLQEPGLMVSECRDGDQLSSKSEKDMEFQQIVKQFRSLTGEVIKKEAAGEKPCLEKALEVSQGIPEEVPKKAGAPEGALTEKTKITALSSEKKETIPQEVDASMPETQKPRIKWYSPLVLADRANEGFLFIARSAGKAGGGIQSGTMGGLSKIEHGFSRKKKKGKSGKPARTGKIKEKAPKDEAPESSKSSLPKLTAENDVG